MTEGTTSSGAGAAGGQRSLAILLAMAAAQQTVADALDEDAEVMSNTQLEEQLAGQPEAIQDEIIRINTDARPLALQVALLIPALAGLLGLLLSFRMMRLPDPAPSASTEGMAFG